MRQLRQELAISDQHNRLYHFTDVRNLPSIRKHGLLSVAQLEARRIEVAAPGGNQWSREADARLGMQHFVHLCLLPEHPMEYRAKQDGRLGETIFLRVRPAVLNVDGVLFTDAVANKADVIPRSIEHIDNHLDHEVIYRRTDWKDPEVRERRNRLKKFEILIPDQVPVLMLEGL
jgi:hypothetical protein